MADRVTVTREMAIVRWPRVVAHLICESLGYFTPLSAAYAIEAFKNGKGCWCEWYSHMAGGFSEAKIKEVGDRALRDSIKRRHFHRGYMTEYRRALALVLAEKEKQGATAGMMASWF